MLSFRRLYGPLFFVYSLVIPQISLGQAPSTAPTPRWDDLRENAQMLKQNLLSGDARSAHMRVILMGMLLGDSPKAKKVAEQVAQMQARPTPLDIIPSVARLLPAVDDLLKAIGEGDADATDADLQQLSNRLGNMRTQTPRNTAAGSSLASGGDHVYDVRMQLQNSLAVNDVERSVASAEEMQGILNDLASKHKYIPEHALTIYMINDALGRAAFQKGDYKTATDYLEKAADIPPGTSGAAMLDSFGPNMWLAEQLLRVGKKDEVVKFLQTCKERVWLHENDRADHWIAEIQQGSSNLQPNSTFGYEYTAK